VSDDIEDLDIYCSSIARLFFSSLIMAAPATVTSLPEYHYPEQTQEECTQGT
jgi:hypothetical protein